MPRAQASLASDWNAPVVAITGKALNPSGLGLCGEVVEEHVHGEADEAGIAVSGIPVMDFDGIIDGHEPEIVAVLK